MSHPTRSTPGPATLDWFGCATFRLTVGPTVIFLDAFLDKFPGAAGPAGGADDIDVADWIVVGHAHFDHLWGAERIAARTGATIIGSYETVRIMEREGVPADQLVAVAGGERIRLSPDVTVSVYPSLHSAVWTNEFPAADEVCIGDLWLTVQDRQAHNGGRTPADGLAAIGPEVLDHFTRANSHHPRGDGGPLLFLFDTPEGQLLFQDTSGHWGSILQDLRPDVAILAAAARGNVDGEPVQGSLADFIARQAMLLRPRRVLLSHHDEFLPGLSAPVAVEPIRTAVSRTAPATEVVEIDYVSSYPLFTDLPGRAGGRTPPP